MGRSARTARLARFALAVAFAGCGDDGTGPTDAGPPVDVGPIDAGPPPPCSDDSDCPGSYCAAAPRPGVQRLCCVPSGFELCGDFTDQNCDRMDAPCGDTDGDGTQACTPVQDPIGSGCDCDDSRPEVRPRVGDVAGAIEACDGLDNDCNGRADESSACCDGCASLGENRDRADLCLVDGTCDCSTDDGSGPCGEGLTCCASGCTDVSTDFMNCGTCGSQCTISSDGCAGRTCVCGSGPPCDLDATCTGGTCPMM